MKSSRRALTAAVIRRKLENELQAVLIMLGSGRGNERLRRRARLLAIALERIEQQDYGLCAHCGAPMSDTRLKLMPETAACAKCQRGSTRLRPRAR